MSQPLTLVRDICEARERSHSALLKTRYKDVMMAKSCAALWDKKLAYQCIGLQNHLHITRNMWLKHELRKQRHWGVVSSHFCQQYVQFSIFIVHILSVLTVGLGLSASNVNTCTNYKTFSYISLFLLLSAWQSVQTRLRFMLQFLPIPVLGSH